MTVFLGGTCGRTTWREDTAIPYLSEHNIKYFDPSVPSWTPLQMELEERAKEHSSFYLFYVTRDARSLASLLEIAFLAGKGVCLSPTISTEQVACKSFPIPDSEQSKLRAAREFTIAIASTRGYPVFARLEDGLRYISSYKLSNMKPGDSSYDTPPHQPNPHQHQNSARTMPKSQEPTYEYSLFINRDFSDPTSRSDPLLAFLDSTPLSESSLLCWSEDSLLPKRPTSLLLGANAFVSPSSSVSLGRCGLDSSRTSLTSGISSAVSPGFFSSTSASACGSPSPSKAPSRPLSGTVFGGLNGLSRLDALNSQTVRESRSNSSRPRSPSGPAYFTRASFSSSSSSKCLPQTESQAPAQSPTSPVAKRQRFGSRSLNRESQGQVLSTSTSCLDAQTCSSASNGHKTLTNGALTAATGARSVSPSSSPERSKRPVRQCNRERKPRANTLPLPIRTCSPDMSEPVPIRKKFSRKESATIKFPRKLLLTRPLSTTSTNSSNSSSASNSSASSTTSDPADLIDSDSPSSSGDFRKPPVSTPPYHLSFLKLRRNGYTPHMTGSSGSRSQTKRPSETDLEHVNDIEHDSNHIPFPFQYPFPQHTLTGTVRISQRRLSIPNPTSNSNSSTFSCTPPLTPTLERERESDASSEGCDCESAISLANSMTSSDLRRSNRHKKHSLNGEASLAAKFVSLATVSSLYMLEFCEHREKLEQCRALLFLFTRSKKGLLDTLLASECLGEEASKPPHERKPIIIYMETFQEGDLPDGEPMDENARSDYNRMRTYLSAMAKAAGAKVLEPSTDCDRSAAETCSQIEHLLRKEKVI